MVTDARRCMSHMRSVLDATTDFFSASFLFYSVLFSICLPGWLPARTAAQRVSAMCRSGSVRIRMCSKIIIIKSSTTADCVDEDTPAATYTFNRSLGESRARTRATMAKRPGNTRRRKIDAKGGNSMNERGGEKERGRERKGEEEREGESAIGGASMKENA